jgi:primosomal protein N'
MARLRGSFRYQIQLQSTDGAALRELVERATADLKASEGVSWIVDVDPLDMM